jgi:signal peptidase I
MSPTTLLADPSVRLAGVRPKPRVRRGVARPRPRLRPGWLAAAALIALAFAAVGYLRTWPPLATVMSASMEPTIKTGDMVVLKRLDGPARVGDVVSISVPNDARARLGYPPVVIHRIVHIDADGAVTTQGDAFDKPDDFRVPRSALTTKVVATVPAAGRALAFLGSPLGPLWLVGGGALLVGMPLLERYRDGQRREHDKSRDLHAALESVTHELVLLREARDHELEAAVQEAAEARDQLAKHLEQLPAVIECAVAAALAAYVPPPPPPPPPAPAFIAASQWKPPTPDLMGVLAWDAPPTGRFKLREDAVDCAAACSS